MIDLLAFDADDTLWENEPRYRQGEELLAGLLGIPLPRVVRHLYGVEMGNLEVFGYGVKAFTLSMVQAATELGGDQLPADAVRRIVEHGKWMIDGPIERFAGARETLERLAPLYRLMVITKGDSQEQGSRLRRSGLEPLFQHVEVVPEKREQTYVDILARYGVSPERFAMVGNSLKSDILPVTAIGGKAIYVPYAGTWQHEKVDEAAVDDTTFVTVERIADVPEALIRGCESIPGPSQSRETRR